MERKTSMEKKIGVAQKDVSKAKKRYNTATSNLQKLLNKRDAARKMELLSTVGKRKQSYEAIMYHLEDGNSDKNSDK